MKKKLLVFLAFVLVCAALVTMLAVSAFAADEEIVITYQEKQSGGKKEVAVPNVDGSYTIKDKQLSGDSSVTFADGTVVPRTLYGWFTEEGDFYDVGTTVTFTESTTLYQAYGVTANTFDDLKKAFSAGGWVRLGCDIDANAALTNGQTTSILDLNGFTYTCTNTTGNSWGAQLGVFGCTRGSYAIMGNGTIIQGERTKDKNGEFFAKFETHGYGDESNPQDFWVGKGVKIITPYPLLYVVNQPKLGMPDMKVAGTIEAKMLLKGPSMQEGTLDIFESASITLSGEKMVEITTLNANPYTYLTVTIHGGNIKMTNENAEIVTDEMIKCCEINILGGSFAIPQAGIDKLAPYMAYDLVLKEQIIDDVVYQVVSEPDCRHTFELDAGKSVAATKTENGKDVFVCSICGEINETVSVYSPALEMITVKVLVEDAIAQKTVTLESVATIEKMSAGADAYYMITALAETDSEGNKLVSVQIPFGVSKISLTGANNTTIEELEIIDGANVRIAALYSLQALKTVKIDAADVIFSIGTFSTNNKVFESIISHKAGANVSFEKQSVYYYNNNKLVSFKELVMSSGSSYSFGESSFAMTSMESLVFPDGATITFTGNSAFNNCSMLKYIYCGDGVTKLNYRVFEKLNSLECVVLMNVTEFNDSVFAVEKEGYAKTDLAIYVHAADVTSINKNAFVRRNNFNVKFYTIDADIVSLQNCLWTVYNGIPHGYADGIVREPSCILPGIVGSTTDCPCGENKVVTYTIYTPDGTTTGTTEQRETELSTVHVLGGALVGINYHNGYDKAGTREYLCGLCGNATVEDTSVEVAPVFDCIGYSVSEAGAGGIVIGYLVNNEILNEINGIDGTTLRYGVFAVSQAKLGENDVFDANGKASDGVLYSYIWNDSFKAFEMKITGFTTDIQKEAVLAIGAFVELTVGEEKEISYIQGGEAADGEKYFFASYNEMVALAK